MRKFFTILAVIATLFCLTSCMKDKEQNIQRFDDFIKSLVQKKNSLAEEL